MANNYQQMKYIYNTISKKYVNKSYIGNIHFPPEVICIESQLIPYKRVVKKNSPNMPIHSYAARPSKRPPAGWTPIGDCCLRLHRTERMQPS